MPIHDKVNGEMSSSDFERVITLVEVRLPRAFPGVATNDPVQTFQTLHRVLDDALAVQGYTTRWDVDYRQGKEILTVTHQTP